MSTKPSSARGTVDWARPPSRLALATFLPYRLNVLASLVSDGLARTYAERFGIGIPEWRVIATVGEFGSVTAKAIGIHAHMSKVKVSRAAATLEARGLIRREQNEADLREAFLTLTASGVAMHAEIAPLAMEYVARLTGDFSSGELRGLDVLLERLAVSARSLAGGQPR